MGVTVSAQDFEPSVDLIDAFAGVSVAADFNNNGHIDAYYSGAYATDWCKPWNFRIDGWEPITVMAYNNGDGTYSFDWNNPVNYEDPTFNSDSYVEGQPNNTYMHLPTHTIAPMGRGFSVALDFNNDGLVDLITFSSNDDGGWWYFWDGCGNEELGGELAGQLRTPRRHEKITLYENLGNGRFKMVQNSGLVEDCVPNQLANNSVAVGDYDRDGYVDIAVSGILKGYAEQDANDNFRYTRFVKLYHNNGKVAEGEPQYTEVKIADVIGGTWTKEQSEGEGEDKIVIVPAQKLEGEFPNISGSVHFADVNNDGYLDLLINGYGEIHDNVYNGGPLTRVLVYVPETGRYNDVTTQDVSELLVGVDDSPMVVNDFNKDGSLDMFVSGYSWAHSAGWLQSIYLNQNNAGVFSGAPGKMVYNSEIGITDYHQGSRIVATDFDGDGNLDVVYMNKGRNIYFGTDGVNFEKENYDDQLMDKMSDSHFGTVADFNGNGVGDIMLLGERKTDGDGNAMKPNPDATKIYYNLMVDQADAPAAPQNVKFSQADGKINITWDYDTDAAINDNLAYNVVVRYKDGSLTTLVPADPETGFVKVAEGRHVALRPNIKEYTIKSSNEVKGVGVQAISLNNFTASEFAKSGDTTTSGIENVAVDDLDAPVVYYNLQGVRIANPAKGDLVVKVQGSKASKVVF